jgi:hypothetical protein
MRLVDNKQAIPGIMPKFGLWTAIGLPTENSQLCGTSCPQE